VKRGDHDATVEQGQMSQRLKFNAKQGLDLAAVDRCQLAKLKLASRPNLREIQGNWWRA
jgi:hypothetical protein